MWSKVCDGWWSHPKTLRCSLAACGLWAKALAYSGDKLTDGFVPESVIPVLCGADPSDRPALIAELVASGLWEKSDGGWRFHHFNDWNPTTEEVQLLREHRARAGRKGGLAKAIALAKQELQQNDSKDEANAKQNPTPSPSPSPSLSVPSEQKLDLDQKNTDEANAKQVLAKKLKRKSQREPARTISLDDDRESLDGPDRIRLGHMRMWSGANGGSVYPQEEEKDRAAAISLLEHHRKCKIDEPWETWIPRVIAAFFSLDAAYNSGHKLSVLPGRLALILPTLAEPKAGNDGWFGG